MREQDETMGAHRDVIQFEGRNSIDRQPKLRVSIWNIAAGPTMNSMCLIASYCVVLIGIIKMLVASSSVRKLFNNFNGNAKISS